MLSCHKLDQQKIPAPERYKPCPLPADVLYLKRTYVRMISGANLMI